MTPLQVLRWIVLPLLVLLLVGLSHLATAEGEPEVDAHAGQALTSRAVAYMTKMPTAKPARFPVESQLRLD